MSFWWPPTHIGYNLVGRALKREFPDLKLVADYRDDWLSYYLREYIFSRARPCACAPFNSTRND
jgi:hypothetical protein